MTNLKLFFGFFIDSVSYNLFSSLKQNEIILFGVLCIYFFALLVLPSTKLFFVLSFFLLFALFFLYQSLLESLFFTYFLTSFINLGQQYFFQVIPSAALVNEFYPDGRYLSFSLTPSLIIGGMLSLMIIFSLAKNTVLYFLKRCITKQQSLVISSKLLLSLLLLIVISFLTFLSSVFTQQFQGLSLLYSLSEFVAIFWIVSGVLIVTSKNKEKLITFVRSLFIMSIFIVVLLSAITFLQFIFRSGLGLTIEQRQDTPHFGAGMDENPLQFRPVGLSSHANSNAHELFTYGIFSFLLSQILTKKKQLPLHLAVLAVVFLLCFFAIIFTQSRAVYISLVTVSVLFLYMYRLQAYKYIRKLAYIIQKNTFYKSIFYVFLFIIFLILFDRSLYSIYSFHPRAGFQIRDQLHEEATALWWGDFYFGVGNGMFIPALYSFNPTGIVSYFPESVHNGFMLFVTERGLWTAVCTLIFLYLISRRYYHLWHESKQNFLSVVLIFSYFSTFIIMFFHPFISFFSPVLLIIILYDIVEKSKI